MRKKNLRSRIIMLKYIIIICSPMDSYNNYVIRLLNFGIVFLNVIKTLSYTPAYTLAY